MAELAVDLEPSTFDQTKKPRRSPARPCGASGFESRLSLPHAQLHRPAAVAMMVMVRHMLVQLHDGDTLSQLSAAVKCVILAVSVRLSAVSL